MSRFLAITLASGSALWLFSGCDRVYMTRQTVTLVLTGSPNDHEVVGAMIEAAPKYYDQWRASEAEGTRRRMWLERFAQGPYTTDADGRAVLEIELANISGGLFPGIFPGFDPRKDRVTGVPYLFRVGHDSTDEILVGQVVPGTTIKGNQYTIAISSVGSPRLVN